MALFDVGFCAETLGLQMRLTALVPDGCAPEPPWRVLYLLHGMSDDASMWTRRSRIENYAAGLPLVIVMPEVHRSFYTDMAAGGCYWQFISEELPRLAKRFFRISERREDTFVAGLSMGGYGALKLALARPERFAAAASFSGALDPGKLMNKGSETMLREYRNIFGDGFAGGDDDLTALLERAERPLPAIRQYCGSEDFLIAQNREFRARFEAANVPDYRYIESPGAHTWDYWDECVRLTLEEWFAKTP